MSAEHATEPMPDGATAGVARPAPGVRYGLARGFSFRREAFGGILYHYEGVQPDPRVSFVSSPFLIDLLDAVAAHEETPLDALVAGVAAHFGLGDDAVRRIETFLATLIERGALVPEQRR